MTKIEAIESGIEKWKNILKSELVLDDGCGACSLCDLYRKDSGYTIECEDCPLYQNGFGCLEQKSNWYHYDKLCNDAFQKLNNLCIDAHRVEIKKIEFHIKLMIRHLEICLEKEQAKNA